MTRRGTHLRPLMTAPVWLLLAPMLLVMFALLAAAVIDLPPMPWSGR